MRLSEKQSDFMWMVNDLLSYVSQLDTKFYIKITSWNRTLIEQKLLLEQKRTKTLNSKHLSGLAVDFAWMDNGKPIETFLFLMMGEYWESIGGRWGGRWQVPNGDMDVYHFEYNEKGRREYVKENQDGGGNAGRKTQQDSGGSDDARSAGG